jgi:hypothetical protein
VLGRLPTAAASQPRRCRVLCVPQTRIPFPGGEGTAATNSETRFMLVTVQLAGSPSRGFLPPHTCSPSCPRYRPGKGEPKHGPRGAASLAGAHIAVHGRISLSFEELFAAAHQMTMVKFDPARVRWKVGRQT